MIKLKEEIEIEKLKEYGFSENKYHYKTNIGALDIYCNKETREISGVGFYPVGDRIVFRALKEDLGMENLVDITKKI